MQCIYLVKWGLIKLSRHEMVEDNRIKKKGGGGEGGGRKKRRGSVVLWTAEVATSLHCLQCTSNNFTLWN